jgi:hypothetical protein
MRPMAGLVAGGATATTPLMTAVQNKAFIGLIGGILDEKSGEHADGYQGEIARNKYMSLESIARLSNDPIVKPPVVTA